MRIGLVVGKVSLTRVHPSLAGMRYVLALPQSLSALRGAVAPMPEELVLVDELGATPGARIAFSEGGEAAAPFHPHKKPVDAYAACLIDELTIDERQAAALAAAGA